MYVYVYIYIYVYIYMYIVCVNTLQHTAKHCSTHCARPGGSPTKSHAVVYLVASSWNPSARVEICVLQHTATLCTTLQHTLRAPGGVSSKILDCSCEGRVE